MPADTTTARRPSPALDRFAAVAPGLALCAVLAGLSYAIAAWPALNQAVPLSALTVGILAGVLVRLCVPIPASMEPGIRWTLHYVLRTGIVLLGFRLVLQDMLSVGMGGLALVVLAVGSTLTLAVVLGRALRLPDTLSVLVGSGTGICGASAVVAVDGVVRGREEDVACAIAIVTVFGTIAMFLYPALAPSLGLNEATYSAWAGSSIHEVAQVVAAGFAFNDQAGVDASLYKLSRVAMLAPACAALAIWWRRRERDTTKDTTTARRAPVPLFVALFVVMVGVNSFAPVPAQLHDTLVTVDSGLLAAAMVAMGLHTRLVAVARLGWRPLALGLAMAIWISLLALAGAVLTTG
ncbi:YeiH family protein [Arhodomonas aquaeolei]|uniref:YeiH family protein n=1 Tax=Arhodomonas aquaeolei TaxID=2369 RepID=UPI00037FC234|nr:YeiH family protein [Arhodomonas aquaeolei]